MAKKTEEKKAQDFTLAQENLRLIAIGFAIIVLGLILMSGGDTADPTAFNPAIFSFTRITLAPIIVMAGFAFEIYAIMKKPKDDQ